MHFPECSDTLADEEQAAVQLGDWARRHGIEIKFLKRAARIGPLERYVIYVLLTAR